ncbi:hypothetical protein BKA61DRAFT_576023 [Leptodontidium sp. MPI-SDFR-AT-0119]|nr:hypothetical protein BKA61DRAFT_576023 [Leptodontidium sp. MPI-SDFR-AT-0119]
MERTAPLITRKLNHAPTTTSSTPRSLPFPVFFPTMSHTVERICKEARAVLGGKQKTEQNLLVVRRSYSFSDMPVYQLVSLTITTSTTILSIYLQNKHKRNSKPRDITLWLHPLCSAVLPLLNVSFWIFDIESVTALVFLSVCVCIWQLEKPDGRVMNSEGESTYLGDVRQRLKGIDGNAQISIYRFSEALEFMVNGLDQAQIEFYLTPHQRDAINQVLICVACQIAKELRPEGLGAGVKTSLDSDSDSDLIKSC